MLLSITNERSPATDLGYLLHKKPTRFQEYQLNFGRAYVFYPEADSHSCTACLLLDIDPVDLVRGKPGGTKGGPLAEYVNDRPYAASSLLSVALSRVFGTAMQGKCRDRPHLPDTALPLTVRLPVLPCRGGEDFLRGLFEPLGYRVEARARALDDSFPEWGDSVHYQATLKTEARLKDVLTHLYVLIPVLDNDKHYYVDEAEIDKLLARGKGWLAGHPMKEAITRRYLKYQHSMARQALLRLSEEDSGEEPDPAAGDGEISLEKAISLDEQRVRAVLAKISDSGAGSVLDLGCGDGKLIRALLPEKGLARITGMDISIRRLEIARRRLQPDKLPLGLRNKVSLFHGSLMYRDKRLSGYDAAVVMEVVEHLDPPRLAAFERVLFEHARPRTVILTTPNREYNVLWETLPPGALRHTDHRFEWTREEFRSWAGGLAEKYNYSINYFIIGPEDPDRGSPTQMGVFTRGD